MSPGYAFAEVLPLAVAIAASPFPIVPAILLLFNQRPRLVGSTFLLGWIVGVGLAVAVFALVANVVESRDYAPTWASVARLLIGAVLVVLGTRKWLQRKEQADTPAWMSSISDATAGSATRLGLLLSAANPKVLLLAAAAGLAIGGSDLAPGPSVAVAVAFTAVASVTVALPLVLYLVSGQRMLGPLGRVRDWLERNNAVVMAAVIILIGIYLMIKGFSAL